MKGKIHNGIWVREKHRIRLIPYANITLLYHKKSITEIWMGNVVIQKAYTPLKEFENKLAEENFIRTHRNYIVNMSCIAFYDSMFKYVVLKNGQKIPISRRKRGKAEEVLYNYINKKTTVHEDQNFSFRKII